MTASDFIPIVTERIAGRFDPLKIILFGSFARGEGTEDSDLDLLVVLPWIGNKHETTLEVRRSLSDLPVCKDVFVTTPEEMERRCRRVGDVVRAAVREGKVIYERG
jgi:predicted nucleotidyltransferase